MQSTTQVLIAMVIYMSAVILIGILCARRANKNSQEYFWAAAVSVPGSQL